MLETVERGSRASSFNSAMLRTAQPLGIQNTLWGFGMRYTIRSGGLAVHNFVKNNDYGNNGNKV